MDLALLNQDPDDNGSETIGTGMEARRSGRKLRSQLEQEKNEDLSKLLTTTDDSLLGLSIRVFPNKGRGIVTTRSFIKNQPIVEYSGELLTNRDANEREAEYARNPAIGSFMYFFTHAGKRFCVDATAETGRFGRLINHSRKAPNCGTKLVVVGQIPRLVIFAKKDIPADTEIVFDYGDRSRKNLVALPWLAL